MNIEQYRALKAQESATPPTPTTPEPTPTQTQETTPTETPKPTEETKASIPEKITIDGVGEVTFEELQKGYLRQADYTRKTQEVSRKTKEVEEAVQVYEKLKANPQLTQQVFQGGQVPANLDPMQAKVIDLENKLYDMMLEKEIETLQSKYDDFEITDVLKTAQAKNITNLEDAYILAKSLKPQQKPQSIEEVKKQLRQELLKEIEQEKNATQSIISSNDGVALVPNNEPKLSEAEKKVANMMRLSDTDYVKWRDVGRNK